MLTDDLISSLNAHAADVGQPATDLLARVERHAQRQQHRRIATVASIVLILATVGVAGGATFTAHDGRATTLRPGAVTTVPPTPGRRARSAVPTGRQDTAPMGYLTGSMCDPVGAVEPVDYLDWPCVAPVGETALIVEERLAVELGQSYGSLHHPLVRLIATDHLHNGHAIAEWWDADRLDTPAQYLELDGAGSGGSSTPAGDQALFVGEFTIYARSGIASVTLEPQGTKLSLQGGVAHLPDLGNVAAENETTLVGRDATGATQPGWSTPYPTGRIDPADKICAHLAGIGTCSPRGTFSLVHRTAPATGDCSSPSETPPLRFLDWPCPAEADSTTPARVAVAVASVVATHIGVSQPRARLLADTRDGGAAADHDAATLVEVWDAAGAGPALLVTVAGTPGSSDVQVSEDGQTYPGDPNSNTELDLLDLSNARDTRFVFVRSGITAVHYETAHTTPLTSVTLPTVGGVTSVSLPSITVALDGTVVASGQITGLTSDGSTAFSVAFPGGGGGSVPCFNNTGFRGSTCTPQVPSDLPPAGTSDYTGKGPAASATASLPNS